jgi:CHASE2 domain-containing sensor protein
MYGGVIHANILTMILSGNYATLVPVWVSYLITYFVVFWLVLFILWLYKKNPHPAHWKLLLAQIGAITVLTFLFFLIFSLYKIKVQLPPIILTLVLAVELFGIYKFLAKRLHKKRKYETIFSHQEDH